MKQYLLKKKLQENDVCIGTFVKMNNPYVVEMLGIQKFDFIIIDREHSNFSHSDVENLVRAADAVGLPAIVRVEDISESQILHSLDSGADGIQVPGIETIAQAEEAVKLSKYYPMGKRGVSLTQRSADFSMVNPGEYMKNSVDTMVVLHVENKTIVDQIDELCQIKGVDVLFIGPGDLSQSIGKGGQMNDPEVVALIDKVFETAHKYNIAVGIYAGNIEAAKGYVGRGAKYIALGSDVNFFANALRSARAAIDDLKK